MTPLYVFRAANNPVLYYVLDTNRRVQIRGETERVQMGIASADIHVLDTSNFLFTLPVV